MKNAILELLGSLRTIHWNFNDRRVSDEDIKTIVASGMHCANSDNVGDYSVIVVDDPEVLQRISGGESTEGKGARCLLYCMDHNRTIAMAQALGYGPYKPATALYNLMIAAYDVCGAAQTAVIAAKSMGIDSLVTNFVHRNHPKELRKLLNLPDQYCIPIIAVMLGYSDEKPVAAPHRIDSSHILHWGAYSPLKEEEIQEMIAEMDCIYPGYQSEKYPHTMDWYFNEWLTEKHDDATYAELTEDFRECGLFPDR